MVPPAPGVPKIHVFKAAETGDELYSFKTPSGFIGNVFTYANQGKQYVGVLSGVGGWAGGKRA